MTAKKRKLPPALQANLFVKGGGRAKPAAKLKAKPTAKKPVTKKTAAKKPARKPAAKKTATKKKG